MTLESMSDAEWHAERDDAEVLRLALVLNGGVSLAVWIGGVTHELDRLRRAFEMERTHPYAELLRCLGCVVRIDVIAGASAGGLNGAMLSSAIAFGLSLETGEPVGSTPPDDTQMWMRDRWLDLGDLTGIMRKPAAGKEGPSSLLDGDGGMLKPLRELVFEKLVPETDAGDPNDRQPVTYIAATTDVVGEPLRQLDDYGAAFVDREHRATLQFNADPYNPWAPAHDDSFGLSVQPSEAGRDATRDKLALAARSTSSFPLAFEPAHWTAGLDVTSFASNRYLADGGIFDNAPFDRVIEAIQRRHATRLTHRVLAYVCAYDDPLSTPDDPSDAAYQRQFETAPTISGMLDIALNKPRDVSMTTGLAELDKMRRGTDGGVRPRDALVEAIATDPSLTTTAETLFASYQQRKLELALSHLVDRGQRAQRTLTPGLERGVDRTLALAAAINGLSVPATFTVAGEWQWGLTAAKRGIDMLTDALLYTLALTPRTAASAPVRDRLRGSRDRLAAIWAELDRLDDEIERAETDAFVAASSEQGDAWIGAVFARRRAVVDAWPRGGDLLLGPAPPTRESIRDLLVGAIGEVRSHTSALQVAVTNPGADDVLRQNYVRAILALLGDAPTGAAQVIPDAETRVLTAIVSLEVLSVAMGGSASTDTPRFEVKRMTARAYGPDGKSHEPGEKLTGLQLGHFGGFLKRSWRANDWMWGRLDAIDHITQLLLAPDRLLRAVHPDELATELATLGGVAQDDTAERARISELVRASTKASTATAATRSELERFRVERLVPTLQKAIITNEVPAIQAARTVDRKADGSAGSTPGDVDRAVAGLNAEDPGGACTTLLATLAKEKVGASFPHQSITRPLGDALAVGLEAAGTEKNRLPAGAQRSARGAMPFAFLFYPLSQDPTGTTVKRLLRTGGLYIAAILAVCGLATIGIYEGVRWLEQRLFGGSGLVSGIIVVVLFAVVICAIGFLAAQSLARIIFRVVSGKGARPLTFGVLLGAGGLLSGAMGIPLALVWLWRRGSSAMPRGGRK